MSSELKLQIALVHKIITPIWMFLPVSLHIILICQFKLVENMYS